MRVRESVRDREREREREREGERERDRERCACLEFSETLGGPARQPGWPAPELHDSCMLLILSVAFSRGPACSGQS